MEWLLESPALAISDMANSNELLIAPSSPTWVALAIRNPDSYNLLKNFVFQQHGGWIEALRRLAGCSLRK
jgi:hypothetical protein